MAEQGEYVRLTAGGPGSEALPAAGFTAVRVRALDHEDGVAIARRAHV